MDARCRVCRHPRVEEIDQDLIDGRLSLGCLAHKFGPGVASLVYHRDLHLLPALFLRSVQSGPASVPDQARLAMERLSQAATSPGNEGVEAAYNLLDLLISLAESSGATAWHASSPGRGVEEKEGS